MVDKKVLIVYYSRSGNTKKVASEVAKKLSGDLEEIIENKNRNGVVGYVKSGLDAVKKVNTTINSPRVDAKEYDVVIIATPIWAGTMASAVRTYINENKEKFLKVAFLCTHGGGGGEKAFNEMKELCKTSPVAVCDISNSEIKKGPWVEKIDKLVHEIEY